MELSAPSSKLPGIFLLIFSPLQEERLAALSTIYCSRPEPASTFCSQKVKSGWPWALLALVPSRHCSRSFPCSSAWKWTVSACYSSLVAGSAKSALRLNSCQQDCPSSIRNVVGSCLQKLRCLPWQAGVSNSSSVARLLAEVRQALWWATQHHLLPLYQTCAAFRLLCLAWTHFLRMDSGVGLQIKFTPRWNALTLSVNKILYERESINQSTEEINRPKWLLICFIKPNIKSLK